MQKRDEDNFDGHPDAYDTKLALKWQSNCHANNSADSADAQILE